jgi:hypothetical protein
VAIGPGDNEEAQRLCREGSFYDAVNIPVHWACATGEVSSSPRFIPPLLDPGP